MQFSNAFDAIKSAYSHLPQVSLILWSEQFKVWEVQANDPNKGLRPGYSIDMVILSKELLPIPMSFEGMKIIQEWTGELARQAMVVHTTSMRLQ